MADRNTADLGDLLSSGGGSTSEKSERFSKIVKEQRKAISEAGLYVDDVSRRIKEHPKHFMFEGTERVSSASFRGHKRFMKRAAKRFIKRNHAYQDYQYLQQPDRVPMNFPDNETAEFHLSRCKELYLQREVAEGHRKTARKHLGITEAVEVFITSRLGATAMTFEGVDSPTLLMYDYDRKVYTFDQNFVARWLTVLTGAARQNDLKTFIVTLQGMGNKLAIYNPIPRWKIAVGNGIYNTITKRLEEYSPRQVVINRIETNYNPTATQPQFVSGITFEKMISDLANGKPDRIELVMQMCKAIITGYSVTPAIFVAIGAGGDGKSVFMSLLSQVIGSQNTGSLNFTDMNEESKVVEVAQKRLVVGMDNNHNAAIKNTALLKSAASREVTAFNRKFLPAISLRFTGTIVQLCNNLPRFGESGSAIRRRIVTILCENSHYERGDENTNLQENIKNRHWHEYILRFILSEDFSPYFTDFNDCDRSVLNSALDVEDPIGSFYDDLATGGFFDSKPAVLPRSLLYAAYQDWFANTYPGSVPVAARTFSSRSDGILREFGYSSGTDIDPIRITTLSNDYNLSFENLMGSFATGDKVQDVLKSSATTRVVALDPALKVSKKKSTTRKGHRSPRKCDALVFFSMWDEVVSDIEYNPRAYEDIAQEFGLDFVITDEKIAETVVYSPYDLEEDDDSLDTYLDSSYSYYMDENNVANLDSEPVTPISRDEASSTGDKLLEAVATQQANHSKTVRRLDLKSIDDTSINFATASALTIEDAGDVEILEALDDVLPRLEDQRVARRFFGINPDIIGALKRKDAGSLTTIKRWVDACDDVVKDNEGLRLYHSASLNKVSKQLLTYANSTKRTDLYQMVESYDEISTDLRAESMSEIIEELLNEVK